MRLVHGCALIALSLAFAACTESETTGTVSMNLTGHGASGAVYRLREGILTVQGPSSTQFFNTEDDPNRTELSANVPVGNYNVFLQEGWHLERIVAGMPAETVPAQLLSANPQGFVVSTHQRSVVPLRFRVAEGDVDMSQGYDIVLDVEEPSPVTPGYCTSNANCATGQTCCMAGFLGTCQTLAPGAACPLPDLTVSFDAAQSSMYIAHETFAPTSCALAEACVDGPGDRRLLHFSTQTPNVGQADMILGDPTMQPGFEFSTCHNHYHFNGYADYQLVDGAGAVVATGHKQAFCLLDLQAMPGTTSGARYHCGFQGISAGWSDVYGAGLDCQWVDITTVPAGQYNLRITINSNHTLPESDYTNNTITVPVTIPADVPPTPGDPLSACTAPTGPNRDCGWSIAAGEQGVTCTPGASITLGCGCNLGTCAGDPVLRVCDGTEACTAATALISIDDSCGSLCPQATFTCPASGVYTVLTGSFNPSATSTCTVAVGP